MKISLVIPTINREKEVSNLLTSLDLCKKNELEIIIVDQNKEDILKNIIKKYDKLDIIHKRVKFRGASRARNYGANIATGEIIGFPDDDSEINENTLINVEKYFKEDNEMIACFGKVIDKNTKKGVINFKNRKQNIRYSNLYHTTIECGTFIRKKEFIGYDEKLGAGTYYGAEESADMVLRMLYENKKMIYYNEIFYFHPVDKLECNYEKEYSYGIGFGGLFYKHYKIYNKKIVVNYLIMKYLKTAGKYCMSFYNKKIRKKYKTNIEGIKKGIKEMRREVKINGCNNSIRRKRHKIKTSSK